MGGWGGAEDLGRDEIVSDVNSATKQTGAEIK